MRSHNSSSPLSRGRRAVVLSARFAVCACVLAVASGRVQAQSPQQTDLQRETVAITYPLEQTVTVRFRGTTRLPRLSGEAKVRRTGRRGTRVELSLKNLPRALEVGGVYTTYVLWAITPEGRTDNLGEIKRSGSALINSKLDVTTPLQTFAMILTAEPHFLVRLPSRAVVLENLPPREPGEAEVASVGVRYIGNPSDYYNDGRIPEIADADYVNTPTSLLGARQAINLARFAGAERDAPDELKKAQEQLAAAETMWRTKQTEEEVDAAARNVTRLADSAEEVAVSRKSARLRREEINKRDLAVREAEKSTDAAEQQLAELRGALDKEARARELSDRDAANAGQQVRDLRTEVERLREELQNVRAEADAAKIKLARLEGERSVEDARRAAEQQAAQRQQAAAALRQSLLRFGSVRETSRGLVLTLPESVWVGARLADLSAAGGANLEPLAALLANNPDFRVVIESYTDARGEQPVLRKLTQDRADALAARLTDGGVEPARVQAAGLGADSPLASNATVTGRARNRRTEITIIAPGSSGNSGATTTASQ